MGASALLRTLAGSGLCLLWACGEGKPEGVGKGPGEPAPWFVEEAGVRGLRFRHESGHREAFYMPEIMGGGAALFDMDGDGDLDAYLVQGGRVQGSAEPNPPNRLFANDGTGRFRDGTEGSGAEDRRYGMGVACGDVDDDGDVDLLITNVGRNTLLANLGAGRFRDATEAAGVGHRGWGTSAGFLDADGDGRLDLYVTNYLEWSVEREMPCRNAMSAPDYCDPQNYETPARDAFYVGLGGGAFADRSLDSGIAARFGTGLGVVCGDFDDDGLDDVFVANDGMADFLWSNRGAGTFEDIAATAGCAVDADGTMKAGMGVTAADVDGDGDLDLLVCNLNRESDSFFENRGGYFADRTAQVRLAVRSRPYTRFGMAWVDFDHDGWLDLYQANGRVQAQASSWSEDPYAEPNLLFKGRSSAGAGIAFEQVLPRGGTAEERIGTSRAAAFGDVDGDGGIDVLVVNRDGPADLLLNRAAGRGSWILLRVEGASGSPALGATVELEAGGRPIRRDVRAAYSYLASNDPRIHVGLGSADRADGVRVLWPDGSVEGFGALEANRRHTLRHGTGTPIDPGRR